MRTRAGRRLRRLQHELRQNHVTNRATCREWVESETKAALTGTSKRDQQKRDSTASQAASAAPSSGVPTLEIGPHLVLPERFPIFFTQGASNTAAAKGKGKEKGTAASSSSSSSGYAILEPVDVEPIDAYDSWEPIEPKPRLDFEVMALRSVPAPPAASYLRLQPDRHPLDGALEERGVRGPRGAIDDGAEEPMALSEECLLPLEHDPVQLLLPRLQEGQPQIELPTCPETSIEYRLQQPVPLRHPPRHAPLLPSYLNVADPFLSDMHRHSRSLCQDFVDDIFGANSCPAGGIGWAGSGGAAPDVIRGDRVDWLPQGGLDRDALSDTDSDGRDEEFDVSAPEHGTYMKDYVAQDPPPKPRFKEGIDSMWVRSMAAVDGKLDVHLEETANVMKERLASLNEELPAAKKLTLA